MGLIEDCKDIYTEFSFTSRWMRIEGFHQVGLAILEDGKEDINMVKKVAYALQVKPTDITRAILLAHKYPDLNDLPAAKDISWSRIDDYLQE